MSVPVIVCAAVFGGAAAAFLPRVAARLAVSHGTPPRSACAHCTKPFPGWVRAGAACPCTEARTGTRLLWTVVVGAFASGLLGATFGATALLLILLPAALLGVLLALIDLRCRRLPNPVVAVLAAGTVLPLSAGALLFGEAGRLGRAVVGAVLCLVAYTIIALLPGDGLGLGDVKLATVLGFVLGFAGWPALAAGLVLPHLINGPIALFLLVTRRANRRTAVPFGPALLAGALLGLAAG
ncbi:prepilin peptidase [Actinoplanes sp. NPDC051859]|uniref:prepilin peptidase n=1 Tax=Actinoplanes sp. NPDC051859 TaxID=3363909 RepID=UPI0037ACDCC8